jgi:hypothetical protein
MMADEDLAYTPPGQRNAYGPNMRGSSIPAAPAQKNTQFGKNYIPKSPDDMGNAPTDLDQP